MENVQIVLFFVTQGTERNSFGEKENIYKYIKARETADILD